MPTKRPTRKVALVIVTQAGPWMQVAANQFVDIERGATEARPWSPPKA
jgi:hypothetical protein